MDGETGTEGSAPRVDHDFIVPMREPLPALAQPDEERE
jgi:hypothetical protein